MTRTEKSVMTESAMLVSIITRRKKSQDYAKAIEDVIAELMRMRDTCDNKEEGFYQGAVVYLTIAIHNIKKFLD